MRRSIPLTEIPGKCLVTNDLGEYLLLNDADCNALKANLLELDHPRWRDLEARGMLHLEGPKGDIPDTVKRTRKSFVMEGPSLHIFVVTLRCDHSCQYCQVSRANLDAQGFDMSVETARAAVDRVFESDAPNITIEFQGGEPSLRFDLIRQIVAWAEEKASHDGRQLRFTMTSTLHHLGEDELVFCRDHGIHLSTSIDGGADLHSGQRVLPDGNSWQRTIASLELTRSILGHEGVAALPTITRKALSDPQALIDVYVDLGFSSIFLRPLAPYGFARKTALRLGYSMAEFIEFYAKALAYILDLNSAGIEIGETNAAIALRHIWTPFHSGYMDLRSPAGAGLGTLVYNHDGLVFPSDEARMAARTGDTRMALGSVTEPLDALLSSPAMRWLARGSLAEAQADCSACAFVPYCGSDPVFHAIVQGEPDAPRHGTSFCEKQIGIFQLLFSYIAQKDPETMRTFISWAMGKPRAEINAGWIEQ
jgi:His-Xaa-Ser system radical SAM maturase HxsB